jgi:hypothetical protein
MTAPPIGKKLSHLAAAAAALVALVATACTRASDSSDAKRMPKPPPTPVVDGAPQAIHVAVEIDGAPQPAIDAAKLAGTPPDFKDDEHRAWRAGTLLGPAAGRAGAAITVTGAKDVAVTMKNPSAPGDPIPVFSLNRRGEMIAELVSAGEPFPAYHGQGGRLSRPGDPLPRIVGVTKIAIATNDAAR